MRANGTQKEIGLLEELMRGKEAIFREEIQGLQRRLGQLAGQPPEGEPPSRTIPGDCVFRGSCFWWVIRQRRELEGMLVAKEEEAIKMQAEQEARIQGLGKIAILSNGRKGLESGNFGKRKHKKRK